MKIDDFYILVEKYRDRIFEICNKYEYSSNISHLFYFIIPIFVIKYGIMNEKLIFQMFSSVPVVIRDRHDEVNQAFYTSIPYKKDDNIHTQKFVVLSNYEKISLVTLLENLIHEYNHAFNSYRHEFFVKDEILFLRTGLTYLKYDVNFLKPIEKDKSFVLEEILNTSQTEEMMNLILNIPGDTLEDTALKNTLYSIQKEMPSVYVSKAYFLQMAICKYILQNKTFISTLDRLRLSGDVEDIPGWFDNITGISNSYNNFITYLERILSLESNLPSKKIKYFDIRKIKELTFKLIDIIDIFNRNCTYK